MGYVYLIAEVPGELVKIGYASNVKSRLASLRTGNPRHLTVVHQFRAGRDVERALHKAFKHLSVKLEWFSDADDLIYKTFDSFAEDANRGVRITPADIADEAAWQIRLAHEGPEWAAAQMQVAA